MRISAHYCRMETLEQFIEEFERRVGERVEAIAIGAHYDPDDPRPGVKAAPVSRDQALLMLRIKFDRDRGSRDQPRPIYAWTASWVMFIGEEDGGTRPCWVPRAPMPCVPTLDGEDQWTS